MHKLSKVLAAVLIVALAVPLLSIGQGNDSTLNVVLDRGTLICGVNGGVPGFGFVDDETGEWSGLDVEYCRAIAAAVLGDADAVEYRPLTAAARFTALASGEIDVLIRNTTWTFTRDVELGTNFGPTTFYDGQGFMVRRDLGVTSLDQLGGATICVLQGTTTEQNLADEFRKRGLDFTPLVFAEAASRDAAYDEGRCDSVTSDKSQLAAVRTRLADPDAHTILGVTISKEPLGPLTRHGDDGWFDIVKWVTFCTFQAEELGVTSANVGEMADSDNPRVRRLVGTESNLGEQLGLSNDFCANAIAAVGNYGELYEANIAPLGLERAGSLNALWTEGGLIYPVAYR